MRNRWGFQAFLIAFLTILFAATADAQTYHQSWRPLSFRPGLQTMGVPAAGGLPISSMLVSTTGGTIGSTTYITPATTGACLSGQVAVAWINSQTWIDAASAFTDSATGASWTVGTQVDNFADYRSQSFSFVLTANLPVGTTFTVTMNRVDADLDVVVNCIPPGLTLGAEGNTDISTGSGSTLSVSGLAHTPNLVLAAVAGNSGAPTPSGTGTWTSAGAAVTGSGGTAHGIWTFYQVVPSASTASLTYTLAGAAKFSQGYRAVQEGP